MNADKRKGEERGGRRACTAGCHRCRRGRVSDFEFRVSVFILLLAFLIEAPSARGADRTVSLPAEASVGLRLIYDGRSEAAIPLARELQAANPNDPLGYLLEAEAMWWKIYCQALELRYGFVGAWRRPKRADDVAYFALADKTIALAEARLKEKETPELHFYAAISYALKARLNALREERLAIARAGVRGREHILRAIALDHEFADAYMGIGVYNYYVDTLSGIAKVLRFFMGIPGGDKREGMRQLERAIAAGGMSAPEARFYLAVNLRDHDRQYERAAALLEPLVKEYPQNPLFRLQLGNMYAKLARNEKAAAQFQATERLAAEGKIADPACAARVREIARASLAALK